MHNLLQTGRFHSRSALDDAAVRRLPACQNLQKRRFSRAVVSDQGDALPRPDGQFQIREKRAAVKGLGHALQAQDLVALEFLLGKPALHLPLCVRPLR